MRLVTWSVWAISGSVIPLSRNALALCGLALVAPRLRPLKAPRCFAKADFDTGFGNAATLDTYVSTQNYDDTFFKLF